MRKKGLKDTVLLEEDDAIVLDNVTHVYTNAPVLKNVSLRIKKGEFVFIVGVSGSGKSTLIKLLLREIVATKGSVYVLGENLSTMKHRRVPAFRRRLGVVFQDFRLLKDMNVYENVAFAQRVTQVPRAKMDKSVPAILKYVGLAGKYKAKPRHLSGGEQQRVALARALVNQPEILLCDEPTGNLDPANSQEIMRLLNVFNRRGTTVVVVTHNKEIVDQMHKRVITVHKGVIESDIKFGEYEAGKYEDYDTQEYEEEEYEEETYEEEEYEAGEYDYED
ncbi:MAG: cell division ATP-binding protein FtsE [Lachnospiraceae bacterium]|nr:cell division ATP-binding protein FtsE [Lachnospiraceae bacterium]